MRRAELFWALFIASVRMFVRNRIALFFSLFVPLLIMVIFGVLNLGGTGTLKVGLVDLSGTPDGAALATALGAAPGMELTPGERQAELDALAEGERDLVVVIPDGYRLRSPGGPEFQPLTAYASTARPRESGTAGLLLNAVVAQVLLSAGAGSGGPLVVTEQVSGRSLGYIDFLVPGMLGFTIMQLGLFSVAFGFVQMKRTGQLRRLFATPTPPAYFLGAQVASRLLLTLVQILILLAVGIGFGLQLVGNVGIVLLIGLLGAVVFLAMGFSVAGWAKDEDQAAPVANLISLPMMFLSGVFFPRDAMPEFLQGVTTYLPLTYLNDAMRDVVNNGAGLFEIGGDLLGMAVWAVIMMVVATRLFRWE